MWKITTSQRRSGADTLTTLQNQLSEFPMSASGRRGAVGAAACSRCLSWDQFLIPQAGDLAEERNEEEVGHKHSSANQRPSTAQSPPPLHHPLITAPWVSHVHDQEQRGRNLILNHCKKRWKVKNCIAASFLVRFTFVSSSFSTLLTEILLGRL